MIGYYIYLLIFFVSWHCIQCNRNSRGVVSIPQLFPFQKERSGEITFKTQGHHISALASTTKFVYTFYYGSSSCESDEEFYFYAIALDTCLQIVGQPSSLKVTISDYGGKRATTTLQNSLFQYTLSQILHITTMTTSFVTAPDSQNM